MRSPSHRPRSQPGTSERSFPFYPNIPPHGPRPGSPQSPQAREVRRVPPASAEKRLRLQERGIERTQRPGAISPHNGHHTRRQTHNARAPLLFRPRRHRAPLSFPQTLATGRSPLMAHSEAARKPRSFPLPWRTKSAEQRPGRAAYFRPEAHKARCSPREPPHSPILLSLASFWSPPANSGIYKKRLLKRHHHSRRAWDDSAVPSKLPPCPAIKPSRASFSAPASWPPAAPARG